MIIELSTFLMYTNYYIFIGVIFLLINAFTAGFTGRDSNIRDVMDSIFWPLSLMVFLGIITRIIYEKVKK